MSRIVVEFKTEICYSTEAQHAVIDICDAFGYNSPWFNDDAWIDDDKTLIIGSGYKRPPTEGAMRALMFNLLDKHGSVIARMTEGSDDERECQEAA